MKDIRREPKTLRIPIQSVTGFGRPSDAAWEFPFSNCRMDNVHSQTVSLIWNIADDVLRDVFFRGQYRDVILPMVVLRRLDALLEPTKEAVDAQVASDKELGLDPDEYAISAITGLSYYNTSRWTLSRLKSQAVDNNDLLLAWKRGLGVSSYDGIVSPAYCVFSTHKINPPFANYLLRTDLFIAEFKRNSTGIIESRLRMYPDDFKNIMCLFPPTSEQEATVAYLDKVTGEIDRAIEARQKMIDALNERKQIIINEVVTGKKKVIKKTNGQTETYNRAIANNA